MRKHKVLAALLVTGLFMSFALGSSSSGGSSSGSRSNSSDSSSSTEEKPITTEATTTQAGPSTVGIGEVFGNSTIRGAVIYADLDYQDYNDVWTEIPEGKKAVFIRIKVTNISDYTNYVSVGDFDCYVDNINTTSEMISGSDDDYNANIDAGRSAILGALYIVPEDAVNIELEYNPIGEFAKRTIIVIADENTTDTIIEVDEDSIDLAGEVSADVKTIGIGDEFGNKTITGVVQDVDLDYTDYNDVWSDIPEGKKAVYITIMVTNNSEQENYVSVGDFACYVDGVAVDAELVTGSDEDYNANIAPGRSAVLGAMYIIPEDASSIELEYNPIGESAERVIIKVL